MPADKQGLSDILASFEGNLSDWKYLGAHNCLSCCWKASECRTDTSKSFAQTKEIGSVIHELRIQYQTTNIQSPIIIQSC